MPDGMAQQPPAATGEMPATHQVGAVPAGNGAQQGASPLDAFVQKPDNGSQPEGGPQGGQPAAQPAAQEPAKSIFDNDVKAYNNMFANTNFAGEISPESMQKVLQGDAAELMNVINTAARAAAANASYVSARVANSGMTSHFDQFQQNTLPGLLTDHSFQQGWSNNKDAILSHPAVAPLVQQQTATFRSQFPQASVNEIQEKVVEYFKAVAGAFGQQQEQQQAAAEQPEGGTERTGLEKLFNF
jgi:hypothetical protein